MSRKHKERSAAPNQFGREWFDRDYDAKTVYRRLWGYARRYKGMILAGMLLGMLTGGAWGPIFMMVRPMAEQLIPQQTVQAAPAEPAPAPAAEPAKPASATEQLAQTGAKEAAKVGKQLSEAERLFARFGISLSNDDGSARTSVLVLLLLFFAGAVGLKMVTQYLNQYFLTKAGMKVVMDLRNTMFAHLQQQSLAFHGRSDVGKLMSRATGDPSIVQTIISSTMSDLCRAPFEVLTAVVFVGAYAIQNGMLGLLLITVFGYPLCMVPVVWIGRQIRRWTARMLEQSAGMGSNFHENLTCIRVVKAYNTEASETEKYELVNLRQYKMNMRAVRFSILVGPLTELVAMVLAGAFMMMCAFKGFSFVQIIPLLPPFLILYKPMKQIGRIQIALENGRAALQRIFSLLDVHDELVEKPDALPIASFRDSIVFDHVSFRYQGSGDLIVNDANFTIKRGQMYAVVGSTGSGKSTLANLLARFYDVTSGHVLLDGHDIRDYRIADLRTVIGAVTQESILFNDTIAANIAYGSPGATREQIVEAAKLANAHAFIMAHPEGYERVVGEKGFVLSGGERQRVAIARAILRNPPILILDEATSALDTVTEQQVQQAINNLMQNRTIFAIAHRLSTIRNADCILVLERGVIKERGTHEELYALGGIYRRLCDIQKEQQQEA
ncbi:MAG TPA: ABC transporter ATP-binding protein [Candidatus Spyradenecus faecavium]|uniref:ABC transporter ATP-binding protein n=1 Tax=Candidatus Spyradenecus faecavium TaxID=2840947 RepID=A0A9D1NLE1_9BACT|nr:ABC transporter ATP-binding protein [Candidatus Spyradenecus faecavium]